MMKYHPNPFKRPPAIKHGVLENPPFSSKIVQLNPAFIDDFPGYKPLSIEDVQLLRYRRSAGWWFGTFWNIFYFSVPLGIIIPTDFHSIIFQRGWAQPPTVTDQFSCCAGDGLVVAGVGGVNGCGAACCGVEMPQAPWQLAAPVR